MNPQSPAAETPAVHTISAEALGRYLVRPASSRSSRAPVLVGFHGYGENAEHHLHELEQVPGTDAWHLISVQALHRFYDRKSGTVVGCWMTSQDREQTIAINMTYVDKVVAAVGERLDTTGPLVYSGFSQGVAMAYRAALRGHRRASGIIALAGDIPPELRNDDHLEWPRVLVGRGVDDAYYTKEKMDLDIRLLESRAVSHETVVFDAGHEWHDDYRRAATRFLENVRG